jgi:hypothetical protein
MQSLMRIKQRIRTSIQRIIDSNFSDLKKGMRSFQIVIAIADSILCNGGTKLKTFSTEVFMKLKTKGASRREISTFLSIPAAAAAAADSNALVLFHASSICTIPLSAVQRFFSQVIRAWFS